MNGITPSMTDRSEWQTLLACMRDAYLARVRFVDLDIGDVERLIEVV